ncbi:MAG: hypothetical protein P3W87_002775 [Gammaproteobacteria bacterium]|nr:hypothetical protein [Gammaproteobacteria bacterium]
MAIPIALFEAIRLLETYSLLASPHIEVRLHAGVCKKQHPQTAPQYPRSGKARDALWQQAGEREAHKVQAAGGRSKTGQVGGKVSGRVLHPMGQAVGCGEQHQEGRGEHRMGGAQSQPLPCLAVQHHAAHASALYAELWQARGMAPGEMLVLAWDGLGLEEDPRPRTG